MQQLQYTVTNRNSLIRNSEYNRIIAGYLIMKNGKVRQCEMIRIIKAIRGSVRKQSVFEAIDRLKDAQVISTFEVKDRSGQTIDKRMTINPDMVYSESSFLELWSAKLGHDSAVIFLTSLDFPNIRHEIIIATLKEINELEKRLQSSRQRTHEPTVEL